MNSERTELTRFADYASERAGWQQGPPRAACREASFFGEQLPASHTLCSGVRCGCACHEPTDSDRALWKRLADEITAYLGDDDDGQETLL
jgi:hypothetical protein